MGEAALRGGVRKRSGRPVPVDRRALLPGDCAIPGYEIAGVPGCRRAGPVCRPAPPSSGHRLTVAVLVPQRQ